MPANSRSTHSNGRARFNSRCTLIVATRGREPEASPAARRRFETSHPALDRMGDDCAVIGDAGRSGVLLYRSSQASMRVLMAFSAIPVRCASRNSAEQRQANPPRGIWLLFHNHDGQPPRSVPPPPGDKAGKTTPVRTPRAKGERVGTPSVRVSRVSLPVPGGLVRFTPDRFLRR